VGSLLGLMITLVLVFRWVRGLVVYFTHRDEYRNIIKTRMYYGEEGGGKEVGIKNQLFFSYPLGILIAGFLTYAAFFWQK
jgi:hypothetical protein